MDNLENYLVCVQMDELSERGHSLRKIATLLVDNPESLHVVKRSTKTEFAWIVTQSRTSLIGEYENWKFKTLVNNLYASYFERWVRFYRGREEHWYLDRAYMHFYLVDRVTRDYVEYMLLHTDPNENLEHAKYKRSPHVHIHAAPPPWPKAHIALNLGYLDLMLKDVTSLTAAFESAVLMVKEEVLTPMGQNPSIERYIATSNQW